jgi:chaperonin GroES
LGQKQEEEDMKMNPLDDKVVIRVAEREKQVGRIIIPTNAQERPKQGTVVAVGPGRITDRGVLIPPRLEPGQTVLYGKYSGTEMAILGEDYLVMRESDCLMVLDPED